MMNKELLLVATGVGLGALLFTDPGKKLVQATMGGGFLPALDGGKEGMDKESKSDKEDDPFSQKHKEEE